jgi:hypothetical protein
MIELPEYELKLEKIEIGIPTVPLIRPILDLTDPQTRRR